MILINTFQSYSGSPSSSLAFYKNAVSGITCFDNILQSINIVSVTELEAAELPPPLVHPNE